MQQYMDLDSFKYSGSNTETEVIFMCDCKPQCMAIKLLVFGLVIVLARLFTEWDIWIVVGVLLIIKAIVMFVMSLCPCCKKEKGKR
jgi:hypothetical protein